MPQLRDLKARGLRALRLLVADGHLGIWSAVGTVFPALAEQRCWNHRLLNVLDKAPPSSLQLAILVPELAKLLDLAHLEGPEPLFPLVQGLLADAQFATDFPTGCRSSAWRSTIAILLVGECAGLDGRYSDVLSGR